MINGQWISLDHHEAHGSRGLSAQQLHGVLILLLVRVDFQCQLSIGSSNLRSGVRFNDVSEPGDDSWSTMAKGTHNNNGDIPMMIAIYSYGQS